MLAKLILWLLMLCSLCSLSAGRKILVTGGAGFIGYHVSRRLAAAGYEVVVLDSFDSHGIDDDDIKKTRATRLKNKGVAILKGSVSDSLIIEYIFNHYPDINAVVHCAAYTSSFNDYNEEPLRGAENNLKSIVSLLDTLVKHKSVNLVYMSTSDVYDASSEPPLSAAHSAINPRHMLASFMLSVEEIVSGYVDEHHLKSAVGLRLFSVYGPWSNPDDNMVHTMTQAIANGKTLEVPCDAKGSPSTHDFVYIEDVVDGIILAIKHHPPSGHAVYNIGTGVGTSLLTVANLIQMELGSSKDIKIAKSLSRNTVNEFADVSVASKNLEFHPKTTLRNGIGKFVLWWKSYVSHHYTNSIVLDDSIASKSLEESIKRRGEAFRERLADLREKYTAYAEAHGIPVAKFYRHKTFKFHPNVEAMGTLHTETNATFEHMKKICDLMDDCVGFNTKGEIKTVLQTSKPWTKGEGLYIADIDMCKAGLHNCFNPKTCVYKGPALFSCVCADGYQSINQKCIERYDEYRSSVTVSDLRLRDILSGLDTRQFTVPDGADFHLFKGIESPGGDLLYVPNGDPSTLVRACRRTYRCVGFSTNGVLKKNITEHKKWKKSKYNLYIIESI